MQCVEMDTVDGWKKSIKKKDRRQNRRCWNLDVHTADWRYHDEMMLIPIIKGIVVRDGEDICSMWVVVVGGAESGVVVVGVEIHRLNQDVMFVVDVDVHVEVVYQVQVEEIRRLNFDVAMDEWGVVRQSLIFEMIVNFDDCYVI